MTRNKDFKKGENIEDQIAIEISRNKDIAPRHYGGNSNKVGIASLDGDIENQIDEPINNQESSRDVPRNPEVEFAMPLFQQITAGVAEGPMNSEELRRERIEKMKPIIAFFITLGLICIILAATMSSTILFTLGGSIELLGLAMRFSPERVDDFLMNMDIYKARRIGEENNPRQEIADQKLVSETLDEALNEAKQTLVTQHRTMVRSADSIRSQFESNISPYRMYASSFLECIPQNANAKEIADLANYYYGPNEEAPAITAIKSRMTEKERQDLEDTRSGFRGTVIFLRDSQLGAINDSKVSQSVFLPMVVGYIKHANQFLSSDVDAKTKVEAINDLPNSSRILEEALNRHLFRIYKEMATHNNEEGKLAVLYGYKFVRDADTETLGEDTDQRSKRLNPVNDLKRETAEEEKKDGDEKSNEEVDSPNSSSTSISYVRLKNEKENERSSGSKNGLTL